MRIFGIDPGSERTGYGCVETDGRRYQLVGCGAITALAADAFPQRLAKIHPKPAMRIQSIMPKYSTAPITFDQFKSTVARIGANSTDSSLRKSYSALMKLQKSVNCSWAEIKRRIEQSQGKPTTAQPGTRRNNSRWLPLTERDWRRIVA